MFKTTIFALLSLFALQSNGFNTQQEYSNTLNDFVKYVKTYNKHYDTPFEALQRFHAFSNTDAKITAHNNDPTTTWQMGHNKFSDQFPFELDHLRGYRKNPNASQPNMKPYIYNRYDVLPDAVDWRANGFVTPVKNQGDCGSCWAFSAVGTMEGQHANATGKLVSLSEQDLVDCVTNCYGCNGGEMNLALDYVIRNGGDDTESSYPYTATDGTCSFNRSDVGATFRQIYNLTAGDCLGLKNAVALVGPISIGINANEIMNYQTGIFVGSDSCDPTALDHGVLVVGYGETTDGRKFWVVKNSWGADWGQDGYIYWSRDHGNMCGICQQAAFATV